MKKSGQIRIIGGQWKRRRVRCVGAVGLRPSPDAVRETLFNWLPHNLHHKSCLDLFAGSGAFGFEAASRGASKVVMVESHPQAVIMLRANREKLRAGHVVETVVETAVEPVIEPVIEIVAGPVERFIRQRPPRSGGFDILFLDPPFGSGMIEATCRNLHKRGFLNPAALVYIESTQAECPLPIPASWHIIREKQCGMVHSTLIQT